MKWLLWGFAVCCLSVTPVWATAPTIDAGPNKTIAFPAKDLTLFGHATDTPSNNPLTVHWTMTSGPAAVTFSNAYALITTVTFTTTGSYTFQLAVSDSSSTVTSSTTVTVNPASSQTAFYVDPTYTGSTQNGSASAPWTALFDDDPNQSARWRTINSALASNDVIVYFSARQAGSDVSEVASAALRVMRTNTSTHRLTLDGMSKYNTNDATPNWVGYTGTHKFQLSMPSGYGDIALGESTHQKFPYTTLRGFEVTGSGARTIIGGSHIVLEYLWSHDVTTVGAQMQLDEAVTNAFETPPCVDIGRDNDITVRNNRIERGVGEGMYLAGNYLTTAQGGCPSYGNTHTDILVEGNVVVDAGLHNGSDDEGEGLDLRAGLTNVTIRGNTFINGHGVREGVVNWLGTFNNVTENYLVENNIIAGATGFDATGSGAYGIGGTNTYGVTIRNNVFYGLPDAGINLCSPSTAASTGVRLYNNTVYGNQYGVIFCYLNGIDFKDNLVFDNKTWNQIINGQGNTNLTSDYNLLAPNGSDFTEGSHSLIQASTSGIVVDATNSNFHLTSTSPARGLGLNLSALGNLPTLTTPFVTDMSGVARPQGAPWDIGAYEFLSVSPAPPTNLRIVQ